MVEERKSLIYALISVFLWSTVASAFKIALKYMDFLTLLFISSFTATLLLFVFSFFEGRVSNLGLNFKKSLAMGFINPFLYYMVLFKSYSLLPAQIAQPINYTWPIALVVLSSFFLREKITFVRITAIVISFLGVFLISVRGNIFGGFQFNVIGILLAFLSAFLWATYWILNKRDKRGDILKLFFNFLTGFIFIVLFFILTGKEFKVPSLTGIFAAIYVGCFEMGITFLFWGKALKYAKNTAKISNLIYLSPFLSLIFIYFIVGEKIFLSTVIGLGLILIGIIIQQVVKD